MTGRPGQTRPLAKEKENEENISLTEDKKNREGHSRSRQIVNDFVWQSVPSHLHL